MPDSISPMKGSYALRESNGKVQTLPEDSCTYRSGGTRSQFSRLPLVTLYTPRRLLQSWRITRGVDRLVDISGCYHGESDVYPALRGCLRGCIPDVLGSAETAERYLRNITERYPTRTTIQCHVPFRGGSKLYCGCDASCNYTLREGDLYVTIKNECEPKAEILVRHIATMPAETQGEPSAQSAGYAPWVITHGRNANGQGYEAQA